MILAYLKKTKRRITSTKIEKICCQINIAALMQPLQYDSRCPAAKQYCIMHAAAAPRNTLAAITLRSATRKSTREKNYAHMNRGGTDSTVKRSRPQPPHTQVPFIAGCSHFTHRKTQEFVLQLCRQRKPHATFMQPLQYVLQHHVAKPNLSTHMATQHGNIHAAIAPRSATRKPTRE